MPCLGQQGPLCFVAKVHDLRRSRDARRCRIVDFSVWFLESILDEKVEIIALIEHLALDVRMVLSEQSNLAVLLRDEFLAHRRDLDVDIVLPKIEIRPEIPGGFPVLAPFEGKRVRFVLPVDSIEIKESRELAFAVVSERNEFGR